MEKMIFSVLVINTSCDEYDESVVKTNIIINFK